MKEYNFDNINEFFEDLMKGKNAKFNMLRVYGAYERECEENKKKQEIKEKFKFGNRYYIPHLISDDIVIVEEQKKGEITGYFACVDGMANYRRWPIFDLALLCAVSIKLAGCEDATEWILKLVKGENNP